MSRAIVWLENDLRLDDNAALYHASLDFNELIVVYVLDEPKKDYWKMGAASRWWLHHSLSSFSKSLSSIGGSLTLLKGECVSTLTELAKESSCDAIYWNEWRRSRERHVYAELEDFSESRNIKYKSFRSNFLIHPTDLKNQQGKPYQVYTPFSRAARKLKTDAALPKPKKFKGFELKNSLKLKDLNLLPEFNWAEEISEEWTPGEEGAQSNLKRFLKQNLQTYLKDRDRPDLDSTSLLSPHLHFGEISIRRVYDAIKSNSKSAKCFVDELYWREFAHYLLYYFPQLPDENLHKKFDRFKWRKAKAEFAAWKNGQTGFPIVDAGMRQLWRTGWMHNRVRMIVGSFLVKDIMLDWKDGAKWFWDTLIDADLANNSLGWQWVAGTGPDAAPYFRIFNPSLQSKKFDPEGNYIRQWVPELSKLPKEFIHEPWKASESELKKFGVEIGKTYSAPILDHKKMRAKALQAYNEIKS